ncbi:MAG: diguanylate cyclase [Desulfobulbaceae bacterium]|nr:diguanylate cyclase [Desulfobulbaceae bacterium]
MFKSLKTTLLFSHTGIILLTNILLGIIFYFFMMDSITAMKQEQLQFTAEHIAAHIQSELQHKSKTFQSIADGPEVMHYLTNYRELAVYSYLEQFKDTFPSASLINEKGDEEIRITAGQLSEDLRDFGTNPFLQRSLSHPNKVTIFQKESALFSQQPSFLFSIAKYHYFGDKFATLLVATVPYEKILENLRDIYIASSTYMILADQRGNTITVHHRSSGEALSINKNSDTFASLFQETPAHGYTYKRKTVKGLDSMLALATIPALDWKLLIVMPYDEFVKETRKARNTFLFLLGAFCFIAGGIAYFLAEGITTPLANLTQAARLISQGKLKEIGNIQSKDEIGKLVSSFNTMSKNLKQTTVSRDYFNTIISSMLESLIVINNRGIIETVNSSTCSMLGYSHSELIGQRLTKIIKKDARSEECPFKGNGEDEFIRDCELIYTTKDGRDIPVLLSASPMASDSSENLGMVCLAINISKRKQAERALRDSEAKLQRISITDDLTLLLNRRGFMTMARKQLQVAKRSGKNIYLMYADVDNLKWVNDNLGHQAGDQVIQETASLLRHTFRDSDIIGRLGGDEFAVLLVAPSREDNILDRLEENLWIINKNKDRPFELSMSTGIVRFRHETPSSLEELMNQADTLMYECKNRKKRD